MNASNTNYVFYDPTTEDFHLDTDNSAPANSVAIATVVTSGTDITSVTDTRTYPNTKVAYGTYAGNSTANRAIPHGMARIPRMIWINIPGVVRSYRVTKGYVYYEESTTSAVLAVTTATDTNFYVGNATNYGTSANLTGSTFDWVAIG